MFLPTTRDEAESYGWDTLDVVLVTGDTYIDSPFIGAAVIGKILASRGYRVGIVAQPDTESDRDIKALGEPRLFWGVTGGSVDSMVANYTATRKRRRSDDFTPGGLNTRRPDRAVIAYANLIRRAFKHTAPIVLGGIEASLRRIAHFDYWSGRVRRSILVDAKADALVYGMGEAAVIELAERFGEGGDIEGVRGVCWMAGRPPADHAVLPSFEEVSADKAKAIEAFHTFYRLSSAGSDRGLCQLQDTRYLVQNPPQPPPTPEELDRVHDLDYERDAHPRFKPQGVIRAVETIRFSIASHRGCFGECRFCAIAVHQGRAITSRGEASILREARVIAALPDFKGYILDVGGPTANMYGMGCSRESGCCDSSSCLHPRVCRKLRASHGRLVEILRKLRKVHGVKKVFVASGLRHDLVVHDEESGEAYLRDIVQHHVSGQLKIAPEHIDPGVLRLMGKSDAGPALAAFKKRFDTLTSEARKRQFLTYYFIAAHPGCDEDGMRRLARFARDHLGIVPEQIQVFTPTPSTYSTLMYWTGLDPFTGKPVFVERDERARERQKDIVLAADRGGGPPRPASVPRQNRVSPAPRPPRRPGKNEPAATRPRPRGKTRP